LRATPLEAAATVLAPRAALSPTGRTFAAAPESVAWLLRPPTAASRAAAAAAAQAGQAAMSPDA